VVTVGGAGACLSRSTSGSVDGRIRGRLACRVMIDKEQQIRTVSQLVQSPQPQSAQWREQLRAAVGTLDAIERPFTDFDRARWTYTSRERYITSVKQRYPEAFDTSTPLRERGF
jgi:hypothetical protein